MTQFNKLKIGTVITNIDFLTYWENYRVEGLGADWAVVRSIESGRVGIRIIEPEDEFEIGRSEFNDGTGVYEVVKEGE